MTLACLPSCTATSRALLRILFAALVALSPHGLRAAEDDPTAPVLTLHAALIDNMRSDASLRARNQAMAPVVAATFYFPAIAEAVLGRHLEQVDAPQRERLEQQLARLSAVSYASQFTGYDGERFEVLDTQEVRGGRKLVRARLAASGQERARFDYLVQPTPAGWRIVNVIANGVSDLSLKRAEYSSVIRRDGVAILLDRIESQITDLMQEAGTSG